MSLTKVEQEHLVSRFDAASRNMKAAKPADNISEREYTIAYQALVKAGLAQQIRKKYR